MNEKQTRWKSKVLWGAVAAQVIALFQVLGIWQKIGIEQSVITDAVAGILQVLAIVGVVNDPTNGNGW